MLYASECRLNLLKKPQSYSIIKTTDRAKNLTAAVKPSGFQVNRDTFTRQALQFSEDCRAFIALCQKCKLIIAYR